MYGDVQGESPLPGLTSFSGAGGRALSNKGAPSFMLPLRTFP